MATVAKSNGKTKLRVGQTVTYMSAGKKRWARVIEDRGRIGVGGRQIVRIQLFERDGVREEPFEFPAQDLQPAG